MIPSHLGCRASSPRAVQPARILLRSAFSSWAVSNEAVLETRESREPSTIQPSRCQPNQTTLRTEIIENDPWMSRISIFGLGDKIQIRIFSFSPHLRHRPTTRGNSNVLARFSIISIFTVLISTHDRSFTHPGSQATIGIRALKHIGSQFW